jgi:hypothetical protein
VLLWANNPTPAAMVYEIPHQMQTGYIILVLPPVLSSMSFTKCMRKIKKKKKQEKKLNMMKLSKTSPIDFAANKVRMAVKQASIPS